MIRRKYSRFYLTADINLLFSAFTLFTVYVSDFAFFIVLHFILPCYFTLMYYVSSVISILLDWYTVSPCFIGDLQRFVIASDSVPQVSRLFDDVCYFRSLRCHGSGLEAAGARAGSGQRSGHVSSWACEVRGQKRGI